MSQGPLPTIRVQRIRRFAYSGRRTIGTGGGETLFAGSSGAQPSRKVPRRSLLFAGYRQLAACLALHAGAGFLGVVQYTICSRGQKIATRTRPETEARYQ